MANDCFPNIIKDKNLKEELIEKEFRDLDINRSNTISLHELQLYLDRKSNGNFDKAVLTNIYNRMDKDENGEIGLDQFKRIWLEVDEELNIKYKKLIEEIKICEENEKEIKEKRVIEEKQESSRLHYDLFVKIINATNIKFDSSYVTVKVFDDYFESKKVDSKFPVFNEEKDFKINKEIYQKSFDNIIKFKLIDSFDLNNYISYEQNFTDLEDQKIHNIWLSNPNSSAKLNVEIRFIHSRKLLCDLHLEHWKSYKMKLEQEEKEISDKIIQLHKPLNFINEVAKNNFYLSNELPSNKINPGILGENKFSSTPPKPDHFFKVFASYLGILIFFIILVNYFFIYVYIIDIFIVLFISFNYFEKVLNITIEMLVYFNCLTVLSNIIHCIWIFCYTSSFWNSLYIDDGFYINYRKLIIIISYILLILKVLYEVALIGYLWIEISTINKKKNLSKNRNIGMDVPLTMKP